MTADPYYINSIDKPVTAEYRDRGSRFIAYAFPVSHVEDFKTQLSHLKKEHPKAVHHCFAYRLGCDGNQFRVSDDGEPSGTAGRPILGQIDHGQLSNVLVVVVRYFGGTLLGVPGLITAYKTVTALALEKAQIIRQPVLVNYRLQFDYTQMNDVMRIMKQYECPVQQQELQLFCTLEIGIPKKELETVLARLKDLRGVELTRTG